MKRFRILFTKFIAIDRVIWKLKHFNKTLSLSFNLAHVFFQLIQGKKENINNVNTSQASFVLQMSR